MHNKYITTCCIIDKKEKLLLLKYAHVDISKVSSVLQGITTDYMDQCYQQVKAFHEMNREKNKKQYKIDSLVVEQLKDMLFIKKKFIEYFLRPGSKTKEDLLTYVFAYKISLRSFNEFIYRAMVETLKQDLPSEFWAKHELDLFELNTFGLNDYRLFEDSKDECSVGAIEPNFEASIETIYDYSSKYSSDNQTLFKLDLIRSIAGVLDNYYNREYMPLNSPYQDSLIELVDNIKVSIDMDQPKQFIKRR